MARALQAPDGCQGSPRSRRQLHDGASMGASEAGRCRGKSDLRSRQPEALLNTPKLHKRNAVPLRTPPRSPGRSADRSTTRITGSQASSVQNHRPSAGHQAIAGLCPRQRHEQSRRLTTPRHALGLIAPRYLAARPYLRRLSTRDPSLLLLLLTSNSASPPVFPSNIAPPHPVSHVNSTVEVTQTVTNLMTRHKMTVMTMKSSSALRLTMTGAAGWKWGTDATPVLPGRVLPGRVCRVQT